MYRGSLAARVVDSVQEVATVLCVADVADSLDGTYFILYSALDAIKYHVWINTSVGPAVDPAPAGSTPIEVAVTTNDSAANVATAVKNAIDAEADFGAAVSTATVTITNAANGNSTDVADFDTGFTTFTTTIQGSIGDVTVSQPGKIHGYAILSDGSADATLKIWKNTKASGNPVFEDKVVGANLAKSEDFSAPLAVGRENSDSMILEVIGAGAVAYVRYD